MRALDRPGLHPDQRLTLQLAVVVRVLRIELVQPLVHFADRYDGVRVPCDSRLELVLGEAVVACRLQGVSEEDDPRVPVRQTVSVRELGHLLAALELHPDVAGL